MSATKPPLYAFFDEEEDPAVAAAPSKADAEILKQASAVTNVLYKNTLSPDEEQAVLRLAAVLTEAAECAELLEKARAELLDAAVADLHVLGATANRSAAEYFLFGYDKPPETSKLVGVIISTVERLVEDVGGVCPVRRVALDRAAERIRVTLANRDEGAVRVALAELMRAGIEKPCSRGCTCEWFIRG